MPETKAEAIRRARAGGFPVKDVTRSANGNYFIPPHGVTSVAGKRAYANCRDHSGDKGKCAAISHVVDKAAKAKR